MCGVVVRAPRRQRERDRLVRRDDRGERVVRAEEAGLVPLLVGLVAVEALAAAPFADHRVDGIAGLGLERAATTVAIYVRAASPRDNGPTIRHPENSAPTSGQSDTRPQEGPIADELLL